MPVTPAVPAFSPRTKPVRWAVSVRVGLADRLGEVVGDDGEMRLVDDLGEHSRGRRVVAVAQVVDLDRMVPCARVAMAPLVAAPLTRATVPPKFTLSTTNWTLPVGVGPLLELTLTVKLTDWP